MKTGARRTMHRHKVVLGLVWGGILFLVGVCLLASGFGHFSFNPPLPHAPRFSANTISYPSRLSVVGNRLVNSANQKIILKGLMPPDPAKLNSTGRFNRALIQEMRDTGANAIRIPVHPENWEQDPDYLWRYLDPLVTWSGEVGLYVIIDLHFIGNIETGAGGQMPELRASSKAFTLTFWRLTASYFKDTPNVIFEIVNEPQSITPSVWRQIAAGITMAIRNAGADQLIVVGGIDYAKDPAGF